MIDFSKETEFKVNISFKVSIHGDTTGLSPEVIAEITASN